MGKHSTTGNTGTTRRRAPDARSRSRAPLVGGIVLALVVGAGTVWWLNRGPTSDARADTPAAAASLPACSDATAMRAASGDLALARSLVSAYARESSKTCLPFTVDEGAGDGEGNVRLQWSATGAWPEGAAAAGDDTWLAADSVVLTAPTSTVDTLGWSSGVSTDTLRAAIIPGAGAPLGQASKVAILVPDEVPSAVPAPAVAAVGALLVAAAGGSAPQAINYTSTAVEDVSVIKLNTVLVPMSQVAGVNPQTLPVDIARKSAPVESGKTQVTIGGPRHPVVGLTVVGSGAEVAALRAFAATAAGRKVLADASLATAPSDQMAGPLTTDQAAQVTAFTLSAAKRFSTMAVLDASWSMNDPLAGGNTAKIDIIKQLALQAYTLASPSARSGLWTFSTDYRDPARTPRITHLTELARNDAAEQGTTHAMAAVASVQGITPGGGTPLYEAIRDAYRTAVDAYDPAMVNQVLVLTDGINEDSSSTVTLDQLLADLRAKTDPQRPVALILVALDPGASWDSVQQIAAASGGTALEAATLDQVPGVFQKALFGS